MWRSTSTNFAVQGLEKALHCKMRPFAVILWHLRLNRSYYKSYEIKGLATVNKFAGLTWSAKQSILSSATDSVAYPAGAGIRVSNV